MFDLVRLIAGALALFLLPGYALLAVGRNQLQVDWVEALCMAPALSLAAVPLFLYLTTLLGLKQGPAMVWGLLFLCALVVAWNGWAVHKERGRGQGFDIETKCETQWVYAALAIVFSFTLVARLWSIRGLEYPPWTDSYGHAVITQLVLDQGMVPTTYEPYAPIADFTYHFGFHALAAWYHWMTGVPMLTCLVILGQLLNVLVVPTTFLFAGRFVNSRIAGLAAAVVAALISHMPALFVNWGRYTQLDGQMLLPIAAVLYLALLQTPVPRYRLLLLTVVAFAGLFLVHYRVFLFAVLLAAILFGWALLQPPKGQSRWRLLLETALLLLLGLLVLAPWLWRLAQGFGGNFATVMVSGYEAKQYGIYYEFDPKELLDFGMYGSLWVLAGIGAIWGLMRRNGIVIILLLWMLSLFAAANLYYLDITPLYSNTIVIISLYLPVASLIGYLVQEIVIALLRRWAITSATRQRLAMALMALLVLLGVGAVVSNARMVEQENIFVREADLRAIDWIRQETAQDALFYVATSFWTPGVAHGLDGGYYLPLLAARQTVMPLQHYASDGSMEYRNLVNQRLLDLAGAQDAESLWDMLNRYAISHIYIGVRKTQLDPDFFLARPDLFVPLYQQDGVWVFGVNRPEA